MKALFLLLSNCILLVLYTYTGLSKLAEQTQFRYTLQKVLSSYEGAATLAWMIPVTELVVVLLLFFPVTRRIGLLLSFLLLLLFTLYLLYMIVYLPELPCSCGGVVSQLGWRGHVVFNCFLIGINSFALYYTKYMKRTAVH
jgi:putative oxidoreductase